MVLAVRIYQVPHRNTLPLVLSASVVVNKFSVGGRRVDEERLSERTVSEVRPHVRKGGVYVHREDAECERVGRVEVGRECVRRDRGGSGRVCKGCLDGYSDHYRRGYNDRPRRRRTGRNCRGNRRLLLHFDLLVFR